MNVRAFVRLALVLIGLYSAPTAAVAQARIAQAPPENKAAGPVLDRPARLDAEALPLAEALTKLSKASGVTIAFSPSVVEQEKRVVTCRCAHLTLREALQQVLEGTTFKHSEFKGQVIVFRPADDTGTRTFVPAMPLARLAPQRAILEELLVLPPASEGVLILQGTVAGTVTDAKSNQPIVGAEVHIPSTSFRALTNAAGQFRLTSVPDGAITVQVQLIGYVTAERRVTVASGATVTVDFQLAVQALVLDELVVTGTAGAARRREIGNSITQVTMSNVVTATRNIDALLQTRSVGMTVLEGNASAGAGSQIRLRGNVSAALSNMPLVYIDGVRVRSDGYNTRLGGRVQAGPLNDINPADIERIEIIKGPAASTLYGTEAAAGVIQIITKRGAPGRTLWTVQIDQGFDEVRPFGIPENPYVWMEPYLNRGYRQNYNVSARGGGDGLTYFVSAGYEDHQFVMQNDWEKKLGVRGNFGFNLLPQLNVQYNAMYANHDISNTPNGNNSSGLGVSVFRYDRNQFGSTDPNLVRRVFENEIFTYIDRLIQGATVTYTPNNSFTHRLTVGYDRANTEGRDLLPYGHFARETGFLVSRAVKNQQISLDYTGTLSGNVFGGVRSSLSYGAQTHTTTEDALNGTAENFPGAEKPTLTNGSIRNVTESKFRTVIAGGFVQNVFDLKGRYFLTLGLRLDGSSTFGSDFGLQTYPKASLSYVVSDEPFWPEGFGQLKLRASYGHSGRQPGAFDANRTWTQVGYGGRPAFQTTNLGNPLLGPERTAETEVGFDASLLDGRLTADVTYYSRQTTAALFSVLQAPSLGFPDPQLNNVGKMKASGLEVALNATVLQKRNFGWDVGLNVATHNSLLISLGGASPFGDASGGSGFYYEGQPFPVIVNKLLLNPNEIADPVFKAEHFFGPNNPTLIVTPLTTIRLPGGVSLLARGEYQGGHYLADNASTGGYRRGVPWPLCTRAYELMAANQRNEMTAFERAWCVQSNVSGTDIYPADFFKLREATVYVPLRVLSQRLSRATLSVSARNWFTWRNKDFKIMDPEATNDIGISANVRSITEAVPPAASVLASLRITF